MSEFESPYRLLQNSREQREHSTQQGLNSDYHFSDPCSSGKTTLNDILTEGKLDNETENPREGRFCRGAVFSSVPQLIGRPYACTPTHGVGVT